MKTQLFQIELLGGPADGKLLWRESMPGGTLRMSEPVPAASRALRRAALVRRLSTYHLARGCCRFDAQGLPAIQLAYEFAGTSLALRPSAVCRLAARLFGPFRAAGWRRQMATARSRFAAWMRAPIDYPFKIEPTVR